MIPDFNDEGHLPPGEYEANIEEVKDRFGGSKSLKRSRLTVSLWEFIKFIQYHAIRIYIDGSYTTNKLAPNDVDLLVILKPNFYSNLAAADRLLKFVVNNKNKLHIFAYTQGHESVKAYLEWFKNDRNLRPKGIVFIEGKDDKK